MKPKIEFRRARQGKGLEVFASHGSHECAPNELAEVNVTISAIRQEIQLIQADMDLLLEEWSKHTSDVNVQSMPCFSTAARYISLLSQQRLEKEKLLASFERLRLERFISS